ncbi:hypothetical protein CDAR_230551, partial [Caerostris darwini]
AALNLIPSSVVSGCALAPTYTCFQSSVSEAPRRSPTDFQICLGRPWRSPTPSFHSSVACPIPSFPLLFSGAPRRSPEPDFPLWSQGAPWRALHLVSIFCLGVRPGAALHVIFSSSVPGAPRRSPTTDFPLSRLRPGAALHLVFTLLSSGAPRRSPTPDFPLWSQGAPWRRPTPSFQSSVSECAPAPPYT